MTSQRIMSFDSWTILAQAQTSKLNYDQWLDKRLDRLMGCVTTLEVRVAGLTRPLVFSSSSHSRSLNI